MLLLIFLVLHGALERAKLGVGKIILRKIINKHLKQLQEICLLN